MFNRRKKKTEQVTAAAPVVEAVLLPVPGTVSYGGWLIGTALHLDELYDFLATGKASSLLDEAMLDRLRQSLSISSITREIGYQSYLRLTTESDIEIRYYEDGLYVLELSTNNPDVARQRLIDYHDLLFRPALDYLFSKEVAPAQLPEPPLNSSPMVVSVRWPHPSRFEVDARFGAVRSTVSSDDIAVYQTAAYIFVVSSRHGTALLRDLVDMQVFFGQFQLQLQHYLALHRQVWSEATMIAERKWLQNGQLAKARALLYHLQKTASLTNGRLRQIEAYAQTRADLAAELSLNEHLSQLFHFRFEALEDSFAYLAENWRMTTEYIDKTVAMLESMRQDRSAKLLGWTLVAVVVLMVSSVLGWLKVDQELVVEHAGFVAVSVTLAIGLVGGLSLLLILKHGEVLMNYSPRRRPASKTSSAKKK